MAASTQDVQSLVTKLRGKGLDDAQVSESLRGMGYTKAEAAAAVGSGGQADGGGSGRSSRRRPKSPAGGGESPAPTGGTSAFGGQLMPSLPSLPSPTLKPPRRLDSGDLAGFLTGLLLFTLGLNYLRYGVDGPKAWLSAKFLNKVTLPATGTLTPGGLGDLELPEGLTSSKAKNPTIPKN